MADFNSENCADEREIRSPNDPHASANGDVSCGETFSEWLERQFNHTLAEEEAREIEAWLRRKVETIEHVRNRSDLSIESVANRQLDFIS